MLANTLFGAASAPFIQPIQMFVNGRASERAGLCGVWHLPERLLPHVPLPFNIRVCVYFMLPWIVLTPPVVVQHPMDA